MKGENFMENPTNNESESLRLLKSLADIVQNRSNAEIQKGYEKRLEQEAIVKYPISQNVTDVVASSSLKRMTVTYSDNQLTEQEKMKQAHDQINTLAKEIFNSHYEKAAPVLGMFGYFMGIEDEIYYLYDHRGEKLCELTIEVILDRINPDGFTLNGFTYEGAVNDTRVQYAYSKNETNSDGTLIYRNVIIVDNIQKQGEAYSGKQVKIELGGRLHEGSEVPWIEVTITKPDSDEKITKFYVDPYDLRLKIKNNFGLYGNFEDGTVRSVHYTDTSTTPYVKTCALLLHEFKEKGNSYNISIDRKNNYSEIPIKYTHRTVYFKSEDRGNPEVNEYSFNECGNANKLACEYLKTSRVKNLYNHILGCIDTEANGMKDFIHKNYPFTESFEKIMIQTPASEQEELVNSFAIQDANVSSENGKNDKKYLKRNQK